MKHLSLDEKRFLNAARAALDTGVDNLDPEVVVRLARARNRALDAEKTGTFRLFRWLPVPAAGLATAALAAALIFYHGPAEMMPETVLADAEIITAQDTLDLYADLDFYTWLAEEQDDAG